MLRPRDRKILFIAVILFLSTQALIFASIPNDTDGRLRSLVVKKGTNTRVLAEQLAAEGLVSSRYLFLAFSGLAYRGRVVAGEYELSPEMSIIEVARKFATGQRKIYTLRIVEGYNLINIGEAIEKAGITDRKTFLGLAGSREFLNRLGIPSVSLEGYLMPDTYFYSKETDVEGFIERLAQRTFKVFEAPEVRQRMTELGLDMHAILTFASMIEKESKFDEERRVVASVFHNRLRAGMSLDCDPTVIYGAGAFHRDLTRQDLAAYTPYNTYLFRGLPKGPIASSSKSAIMAVLYPAQSDFLYFVSRNDGTHVFSRTMQEHNQYVMAYQRNRGRKP